MSINNIIKDRRKILNLTQKEVANFVGVSEATLSRWESGNIQNMKRDRIAKLAKVLEISPSLIVGEESPRITAEFVSFPILGEVGAHYGTEGYEDFNLGSIDIPASWLKGRPRTDYFVLKISGDSMYPTYQDGDLILVLKQSTLNYSGQVGVVMYDDDRATLKRIEYVYGEDWMRLVPINPNYPPVMVTDERLEHCRVLGIPKRLIREINQ